MRFTDKAIAALKPKADRYERWEGGGFGVRVSPRGVKSWVWVYHYQGQPRRLTLGTYPGLGLAAARIKLAEARKLLSEGHDPAPAQVAQRKAERLAETMEELVEDYLAKWARPRKRSAAEDERILRKDVLPVWHRRKARDITRRDVIALLDGITERGAPIAANRTLAAVRKMFNWALGRDLVASNPCAEVKMPSKEQRRDRILSAKELAALWHGLERAPISDAVRLALRFQLVTAQRKGEVIGAEWSEIDMEGERVWTIPPAKSKNGMAHRVPLSALALRLLKDARIASANSRWLCPSPRGDRPVSGQAVDHVMRRNRALLGTDDATPHDLRRTAASHMASMGISRLVISKILNHAERGVTAVYDRHSYDGEKRAALEAWAQHLDSIVTAPADATDNVVPFKSAS